MRIQVGDTAVVLPYKGGAREYLALRGRAINVNDNVIVMPILDYMSFPAYQWLDGVTGGTALKLGDDDYSAQALPFTFSFYGGNYDTVFIGSNGYIDFVDSSPSDYSNDPLPSADSDNQKLIAPLWDDWYPLWAENGYPNSDVFVKSFTNPNRYVITWNDIFNYEGNHNTFADRSTFQVILYETGDIRFNYKTVGITNGVTVGINDGDGVHYKSYDLLPASSSSILFAKEPQEGYVALRSEEINAQDIDDIIAVLRGNNIAFSDLEHFSISGIVYNMLNVPIEGEQIDILEDKVDSVLSDVNGQYSFTLRSYGNYTVQPNVPVLFSPTKYEYHPLSESKTNQNFIRGTNLGMVYDWRYCFLQQNVNFADYGITTDAAIARAYVKLTSETAVGPEVDGYAYFMIRDRLTAHHYFSGAAGWTEFEHEELVKDGDLAALVVCPEMYTCGGERVGPVLVDNYRLVLEETEDVPTLPPSEWIQMHCNKSGGFYVYRHTPEKYCEDKVQFCPFGIWQTVVNARMLMTARRSCTSPCDGDLIVKKNGAEIYRHWLTYSSSAHNVYFTVQDGDVIEVWVECTGGSYVSGSIQNAKVEVYKEYKV